MKINQKQLKVSPVMKRLPWTLLVLSVYLMGRRLPLIPVHTEVEHAAGDFLENLALVSGGTFSSLTLFSLGLSPYMTSMIVWRFLSFFNRFKMMTEGKAHRYQQCLMLILATIQAFGLTRTIDFSTLSFVGTVHFWEIRLMTISVLVSGAFVLMWLGNLNTIKGLGSFMMIIISNMMLNLSGKIINFLTNSILGGKALLTFVVGIVLLMFITVIVERAEYRIKIRRINIVSAFSEDTYLPIKFNPAGALPLMYSMTLMILPSMLVSALLSLFPNSQLLKVLLGNLGLSHLPGILIYICLLCLLSVAFSYYNYDPVDLADKMQINGDYIKHIRPGQATANYIRRHLRYQMILGTIFLFCLGGLPLLISWFQGNYGEANLWTNNIYIITTLMLGIMEQVNTLQSWKKYKQLI